MAVSKKTVLAIKSYQNQAEVLVKNYLLSDPFIPYTSILGGIFACKLVRSYLMTIFESGMSLYHMDCLLTNYSHTCFIFFFSSGRHKHLHILILYTYICISALCATHNNIYTWELCCNLQFSAWLNSVLSWCWPIRIVFTTNRYMILAGWSALSTLRAILVLPKSKRSNGTIGECAYSDRSIISLFVFFWLFFY